MITEDLRRFILTSIASVPHLEALLLLRRENGIDWDVGSLARRIYIAEKTARSLLGDLVEAGFVVTAHEDGSTYRYAPSTTEQADLLGRVADAYADNLIEVTNLIHGRSARLFADAFRIRKE